jgi:hypothetical protein
MMTVCVIGSIFCAHDHNWVPHSLTYLFSGIAMVFSYKTMSYQR